MNQSHMQKQVAERKIQ